MYTPGSWIKCQYLRLRSNNSISFSHARVGSTGLYYTDRHPGESQNYDLVSPYRDIIRYKNVI